MTPTRSSFAVCLGSLALIIAAGCGNGSNPGYTSYENLQKDPAAPLAEEVPAAVAQVPDTGVSEAPSRVSPADASAVPSTDAPAVAEVPLIVTGVSDLRAAELLDQAAIAEGPEEILITAASPRRIELLIPTHKFRKSRQGALWVTYDDIDLLKVLNMEPVPTDAPDMMPDWLKGLDGKRIHVRGFMFPLEQATGITNFILARDNQICCFGRDAKVYDLINISMRDGESTDYVQGAPIDVIGTFHILPSVSLKRLYRIDDAMVISR